MRRGFTLTELMMVVTVLAMVTVIIVPMAADNDASQLRAAAELLAADIEDIQARSLANPAETTCLQTLPEGNGWQLENMANPGVPILGPDGEPLIRRFGTPPLAGSSEVLMATDALPGTGLRFDDQGAPISLSSKVSFDLGMSDGQTRLRVEVSASTGRTAIEWP
jgi:prepilin-type N-terminal cleavage/methylation domain-containing protein